MTPEEHIGKARRVLASGRYLLDGGFFEEAGRAAYLAGLHAVLSYLFSVTGKRMKTHRGAIAEFARLVRAEPRLDPAFGAFLGRAYGLKVQADYDQVSLIGDADARAALDEALRLIDAVEPLVRTADPA